MDPPTCEALVARLDRYDPLVEVGVGERTAVAAALADRGHTVTVTDVHRRAVPDGVSFVRDDVTDPDPAVYAAADAVYALNLPPELHRHALAVARSAGAPLLFTTLGGDQPTLPDRPGLAVRREMLAGETLYVVERPGDDEDED